jgi:hypothetical protein
MPQIGHDDVKPNGGRIVEGNDEDDHPLRLAAALSLVFAGRTAMIGPRR